MRVSTDRCRRSLAHRGEEFSGAEPEISDMMLSARLSPSIAPIQRPRCGRVVLIFGTHYNLNLREYYESRYGPPTGVERVTFIIVEGVTIGGSPAVRTGLWPDGVILQLVNRGRICGAGGGA